MSQVTASQIITHVRSPELREALAAPAFRLDLIGLGLRSEHLALLDRLAA